MALAQLTKTDVNSYHGWRTFLGGASWKEVGHATVIRSHTNRISLKHEGIHLINVYRDGKSMIHTLGAKTIAVRHRLRAYLPPHLTLEAPTIQGRWYIVDLERNRKYELLELALYFNTDGTVMDETGAAHTGEAC